MVNVVVSRKRNTNSTNPREREINGKTRRKTVQHTQQTLIYSNQPLYLDEVENLQTLKTVHPTITVAESQESLGRRKKKLWKGRREKKRKEKKGGAGAKVFLFYFFFFGSPRTKTKTERKKTEIFGLRFERNWKHFISENKKKSP